MNSHVIVHDSTILSAAGENLLYAFFVDYTVEERYESELAERVGNDGQNDRNADRCTEADEKAMEEAAPDKFFGGRIYFIDCSNKHADFFLLVVRRRFHTANYTTRYLF